MNTCHSGPGSLTPSRNNPGTKPDNAWLWQRGCLPTLPGTPRHPRSDLPGVAELELHAQTIAYDPLDSIQADITSTIVDLSGSSDRRAKLGKQLGKQLGNPLCRCGSAGITHWDEAAPNAAIDPALVELLVAPPEIQKRKKDWGRRRSPPRQRRS